MRAELLRTSARRGEIARIARAHGLRHAGRFAAEYHAMFGELPSHTVRRAESRRRLGDSMIVLLDEFDAVDEWVAEQRRTIDADETYQVARGIPSSIDDLREDAPHLRA